MARRLARAMSTSGFDLKGVIELPSHKELGRGAYGRVYAVKYCQTICAAKEIHAILVEGVGQEEMQCTIDSFIKECQQCSTLHHPNIVQFLGVYYPTASAKADVRSRMPVMVMEMMADNLASFVEKHGQIPVHIKYSIVHDVSLGLCYLHSRNPPIVHRDLSPNNVLLTVHHVAKISDLGVAKVIKADTSRMTKAPGTADFMPPEARANNPVYGPPMDVFSYAGIILHTFNQQWPKPTEQVQFDPKTRKVIALSEVERRQEYLNKMIGEAKVLRSLTEECLEYVPTERPTIANVYERIQRFWTTYKEKSTSPQQCITLYQENVQHKTEIQQLKNDNEQFKNENERLKNENERFKNENERLKNENEQLKDENELFKNGLKNENERLKIENELFKNGNERLKNENDQKDRIIKQLRNEKEQLRATMEQMSSSMPTKPTSTANRSKLKTEAPPLIPALTSGRYHIKWMQLADLPVPLYHAYAAIKHHKIFVTGDSPIKYAEHEIYVYDVNTNQWGQFPPSGHYLGVPQIIDEKLAIIGGRLSATNKMTNKVSTFDEVSRTWTSYYPNLLSVRSKPGVVSHLEHVIVAGGIRPTGEGDTPVIQDDIEVLNWREKSENLRWRKVSIKLPVPMFGFTPTISDDHLMIVNYGTTDMVRDKGAHKIPVASITASIGRRPSTKWTELTEADHYFTALVPDSSPPVVVGGKDHSSKGGASTTDIKMYDNSNKSWKKIGSLSSARCGVAVVSVHNNAIIVIGGFTKGGTMDNAKSSSLNVAVMGQAELLC